MPNSPARVYISGPISGLTEPEYIKAFGDAEIFLADEGFVPINPLKVTAMCMALCNSGMYFEDGRYMHTWQCYMKYDIIALFDCDAIFMLDGWENSKGATLELQVARALGLRELAVDPERGLEG